MQHLPVALLLKIASKLREPEKLAKFRLICKSTAALCVGNNVYQGCGVGVSRISTHHTITHVSATLTHLTLEYYYNEPIPLIESLEYLKFVSNSTFNQPIPNLGSFVNLKTLIFGLCFNQPISTFPESLEHLTFGFNYNKELKKLPARLKSLQLGRFFDICTAELPESLIRLTICDYDPTFLVSTVSLKLNNSLKYLSFYSKHNVVIHKFPDSLTHLTIGNFQRQPLFGLPDGLRYLKLGNTYNMPLLDIPSGLKYLILGEKFNQQLPALPYGIKYLKLGQCYNYPLVDLPSSLKILHLNNEFNHPLPPNSIEQLITGAEFNQSLVSTTLTHLKIYTDYAKHLETLPKSIVYLTIDYEDYFSTYGGEAPEFTDSILAFMQKWIDIGARLLLPNLKEIKYTSQ